MVILLVDDNQLILTRLAKAIKKVGENIRILKVSNCEQAIRSFTQFNPDLVILDISLPDGSGIDLLRMMKKEKPLLPVFMFSDYYTVEFRKSCAELGADQFMEKSDISGLIDSIQLCYTSIHIN